MFLPYNTGTARRSPGTPGHPHCKKFPLKTDFRYVEVPFKRGFLSYTVLFRLGLGF